MSATPGPAVSPEVLAALTHAVPSRIAKKLDASPRAADAWTWTFAESVTVAAGEETVTLARTGILRPEDAVCTCLLQPRCFHLLAVLSILPLAEAVRESGSDARALGEPTELRPVGRDEPKTERPEGSPKERAVAEDAARISAKVLTDGLMRVSTLRMGELLRVVHACRREGLYRLESAALSVFESARDAREKSPDFRLTEAADRLAELLLVSARLASGDTSEAAWRGTGRRIYRDIGSLRLSGIACEPVLQKGYAGVVTYFTDGTRIFTAQEVMPGGCDRARDAYDAQLRFGETSLSHGEASRGGLLFARAEASADGRLGAGRDVACVSAARDPSLVDRLFQEPFAAQIARADGDERMGLVFVQGTVRGDGSTVRISIAEPPDSGPSGASVPLSIPIDDMRFAYRENLERLAQAEARVRLVARMSPQGGELLPVAVAIPGSGTEADRPASNDERWVSIGYDRLARREVAPATDVGSSDSAEAARLQSAILDPVRRRVLRFALAGAGSLPSAALPEIANESARLRSALFLTGAEALEGLARAVGGEGGVAQAWLVLHVFLRAAEKSLARAAWGV